MSDEVKLKILDSFDRMIDLFAEDCGYEWEYEVVEEDEECEEPEGMECKVPDVEAEA